MNYIIEPYYFWKGHYKKYFENLINNDINNKYVYCNDVNKKISNSFFLKAKCLNYEKNFFYFIFSRIINSFIIINYINKNIKNNDSIVFLEFEPISIIYFIIFNKNKNLQIFQTIHSIERVRFKNIFKDTISLIQRKLFNFSIKLLEKNFKTTFIVHYDYHKLQLEKLLINNSITRIIDYPSPELKQSESKKLNTKNSILLFGLIREDKGIYEFLLQANKLSDKLTIAGKIQDKRVLSLKNKYNIIDKFLTIKEMDNLFISHDYVIIPYGNNYTGGAGPLKDALSYGTPIICSQHPLFKEILNSNDIGFSYNTIDELIEKLDNISIEKYKLFSQNCLYYAKKNTWDNMKFEYLSLLKKGK